MAKRPVEPLLWILFSAGGVIAAMLVPVLLVLFGLAFPLGWLAVPSHAHVLSVFAHPLSRITVFLLCTLSLFHWAHRFRYTLYDGLMLKHLTIPIVIFTYGSALVGSVAAAYLLWMIP